ncbi:MAG: hypothetical protein OXE52_10165 [Chloroflexi bacterium]|nr:hypothetical protein [Chloroflexota bacterium]
MLNLGPTDLFIIVVYVGFLLVPLAVLYLIIRQAVLSALRKFYRELDEADSKRKVNLTI